MQNEICKVKKMDGASTLKAGDEVLLVRGGDYEPETFIVTITCPIDSPPLGESQETGITRVLAPLHQNERFYIIERRAA